jgi:hypothetical protein
VPNGALTDVRDVARGQLREIQREARASASRATTTVARAHWTDIADRVTAILEPKT